MIEYQRFNAEFSGLPSTDLIIIPVSCEGNVIQNVFSTLIPQYVISILKEHVKYGSIMLGHISWVEVERKIYVFLPIVAEYRHNIGYGDMQEAINTLHTFLDTKRYVGVEVAFPQLLISLPWKLIRYTLVGYLDKSKAVVKIYYQ